jgi:phosphohistidine phosphatase SixA
MRWSWGWVLQPLVTALFVIVLGGLVHAFWPLQYSVTALHGRLVKKWQPDHDRTLSDSLVGELQNGGFTLFVRHSSRDEGSNAIDRASVLDKTFVPTEYRRGLCLNERGRVESQVLAHFFRAAKIPIAEVVASPLCRARETAELSLGRIDRLDPSLIPTLLLAPGEERAAQRKNLRELLAHTPTAGANRMLTSHAGVLESVGYDNLNLEQSGMVIFRHTGERPTIRSVVTLRDMTFALRAPWLEK